MTHAESPCRECKDGRHRLCVTPCDADTLAPFRDDGGDIKDPEMKMCCDEKACWTYVVADPMIVRASS
jgi:hypothetical protein